LTTSVKTYWFASMAQRTSKAAGSSSAFMAICGITLIWMVTGPLFHGSDTWQLVINTVTNIVSMLMVFLIQNTQNRESSALQLKLDELLRSVRGAQNTFINLEDLSEDDLRDLKERYSAIAMRARKESILSSETPGPVSERGPTSQE
jgi:low affinity Fe/Cu permease